MRKISKRRVEHALDGLLVDFLLDNENSTLEKFRLAVNFFGRAGYDMREYYNIYLELRTDVESYDWIRS